MVHKKIKDRVLEYEGAGNIVVSLTLKINSKYQLQVVQVYAPTSSHNDEEVEELYEEVAKIMEKNKSHYKIIMGDFNGKVGQQLQGDEGAVGAFGLGERNERGTRLVQFATSKNLRIENTFCKKSKNRKWTWKSPNGAVMNEIDYILSNRNVVLNIEAIQRVNVGSDHRMVRSKIRLNTRLERSRMVKSGKSNINLEALMSKTEEFQLKLRNRFEALEMEGHVEKMAGEITEAIQECALATAGKDAKNGKEKLKPNMKELLKTRREMAGNDLSAKVKIEYSELCKTIRKSMRDDIREHNTM